MRLRVPGRKTAALPVRVAAGDGGGGGAGAAGLLAGRGGGAEGFGPLRAAGLGLGLPAGAAMAVLLGDGSRILGRFAGLAENGRLLLETGGAVRAFAAGEVSLTEGMRTDAAGDRRREHQRGRGRA